MPSSSPSEDLRFLVAENSAGHDPGVQWVGHHAWLDKVYKIPAVPSLPSLNVPPRLEYMSIIQLPELITYFTLEILPSPFTGSLPLSSHSGPPPLTYFCSQGPSSLPWLSQ